MQRISRLVILAIAGLGMSAPVRALHPAVLEKLGAPQQGLQLVWSDEFNGSTLNRDIWNVEVNGTGCGNNELEYYVDSPENVSVSDGNLVITARRTPYKGKAFTSGRLNTLGKYAVQYGVVEARIKVPGTANGLWPAFWMMGADISEKGWPFCGETDILEMGHHDGITAKSQDKLFNGAIHYGPDNKSHSQSVGPRTNPYSLQDGQYHSFYCVWTPEYIEMYVDNEETPYFRTDISDKYDSKKAGYYFHKPNFLLLNLAVGGDFPGISDPRKITALGKEGKSMLVDYVRVYDLPGHDVRIARLLSQMTLEEKAGQCNQLSGGGYSEDMARCIRAGQVGSILNEVDPETVNRLQREAVENSRLHIPLVFARDVIHGFKTMFPIPIGQAATWNPSIVEEGSRISAREASSAGVRWTFSPMVDIARDARWGRLAEGYGEDPFLTTTMGVAAVKGYQGNDLSDPSSIAACTKHFAGYGMSEGGRDYNTTNIPTPLLRDVILPPFKACADAGSATFMCSFNDINGHPSSGNAALLRGILRDEWNYDGMMVSDWNSIGEMVNHGVVADRREAALLAAKSGVDMDMETHGYVDYLKEFVEGNRLDEKTLDEMVRNVLLLKYRLGLFDNPYVDMATANSYYAPASLEAALHAAEESAVLLTNNGVLPLRDKKKILVVGPMADAKHDQNGTWSFDMQKERTVTPLESLREMYGAENVTYVPGLAYSRDKNTKEFEKAVKAARKADAVIFIGGEEAVLSGEAHCRADISLPGAQTELLRQLKTAGKPLVAVIIAGRPITLPEESEICDAILFSFHPGTMGGPAIANILSGKVNPSGKLPISFPKMVGQVPMYYSVKNTGRPTEHMQLIDEIPLEAGQTSTGCTTFWLDAGLAPLFPFGYGLSYTTFEYGAPQLSSTTMTPDGEITVTCQVRNTGSREGADVAQLYIRDMVASLAQPVKLLKGFQKVTLAPGESKTLTFRLPASALAFHDNDGKPCIEPGQFSLWIDNSSDCKTEPVTFNITDNSLSAK